jgi:MOSC domain-containing protein YiiM
MGKIIAVCRSAKTGERKTDIRRGMLRTDHGLEGDAHARNWHRQVSLLARESIRKMQEKGLAVGPGDFAENITTEGIDLAALPVGTRLRLGEEAVVEITQIGKTCHSKCNIYRQAGDCVMPREGVFAAVKTGGAIKKGDTVEVIGIENG